MKKKFLNLLLCLMTLFIGNVNSQPSKKTIKKIDLERNDLDNIEIPDQLSVQSSFVLNDDKWEITIIAKTLKGESTTSKKSYSISVNSNNVDKDFNKDLIIKNILRHFYLNNKNYSNYSFIEKQVKKAIESIIEDLKYEIERNESDAELEKIHQ